MNLTLGQLAPSFTARNQHGEQITTQGLRGSPAVIFFYPWAFSSICIGTQAVHRIARHRQDLRTQSHKALMIIAKSRQLAAADAGECPGVEDDHRWRAAQCVRRHQLAVLVTGRKARSVLAERQTHRRVPLGRTSLVAAQSEDT